MRANKHRIGTVFITAPLGESSTAHARRNVRLTMNFQLRPAGHTSSRSQAKKFFSFGLAVSFVSRLPRLRRQPQSGVMECVTVSQDFAKAHRNELACPRPAGIAPGQRKGGIPAHGCIRALAKASRD